MSYLLIHAETRADLLQDLDLIRTRLAEAQWWLNDHAGTRERLIALEHLRASQERLLHISELLSHLPA